MKEVLLSAASRGCDGVTGHNLLLYPFELTSASLIAPLKRGNLNRSASRDTVLALKMLLPPSSPQRNKVLALKIPLLQLYLFIYMFIPPPEWTRLFKRI